MNDQTVEDHREYLERIPFVSEILKRIDDISQATRQGNSGITETRNLLTDIPESMRTGNVNEDFITYKKEYDKEKSRLDGLYVKGTPESFKQQLDVEKIKAGQEYSCKVKERVINLLDSKGLLFLSRKSVPESEFVDLSETRDPLAG